MGIRFRCHHCEHELNLKNFQAGRRGRCPVCSGRFRVPTTSCDFSNPLEEDEQELASSPLRGEEASAGQASPTFQLKQPTADLESRQRPLPAGQRPEVKRPEVKRPEVKRPEAIGPSSAAPPATSPGERAADKRSERSKRAATSKPAGRRLAPNVAPGAASEAVAAGGPALAQSPATEAAPVPSAVGATPTSMSATARIGPAANRGNSGSMADQTAAAPASPSVPRAIAEAPQAVWYVRPPSGGQFGPADSPTFYQWMKENRVAREALVWRDGWPQWMIAGEALEEYYGSRWLIPEPATAPAEPSGVAATVPLAGAELAGVTSPIGLAGNAELAAAAPSGPALAPGDAPLAGAGAAPNVSPVRPLVRRKSRRANYALWISVLAIVAVTLVAVLITVLMSQ